MTSACMPLAACAGVVCENPVLLQAGSHFANADFESLGVPGERMTDRVSQSMA
jgi:hypothetical protein